MSHEVVNYGGIFVIQEKENSIFFQVNVENKQCTIEWGDANEFNHDNGKENVKDDRVDTNYNKLDDARWWWRWWWEGGWG